MIVLICGGRDFSRADLFSDAIENFEREHGKITVVVSGGATGADSLAEQWAKKNKRKLRVFPADWKKHGRAAGPIRNAEMLTKGKPEHVIAFPGGSGTANMVKLAKQAKVPVHEPKLYHQRRHMLNEKQITMFLRDMHEFGYSNLTRDEVRTIAKQVADGEYSKSDPVARILVSQIDEAMAIVASKRNA